VETAVDYSFEKLEEIWFKGAAAPTGSGPKKEL